MKARVAAEGIAAVRCEGGEIVALAAGGLLRVDGPGLSIALESPEDVALMKIDGKWHGVWQTADTVGPLPAALSALTSHWIRLALPNGRKRIKYAPLIPHGARSYPARAASVVGLQQRMKLPFVLVSLALDRRLMP